MLYVHGAVKSLPLITRVRYNKQICVLIVHLLQKLTGGKRASNRPLSGFNVPTYERERNRQTDRERVRERGEKEIARERDRVRKRERDRQRERSETDRVRERERENAKCFSYL